MFGSVSSSPPSIWLPNSEPWCMQLDSLLSGLKRLAQSQCQYSISSTALRYVAIVCVRWLYPVNACIQGFEHDDEATEARIVAKTKAQEVIQRCRLAIF
jgi:hypothetical protein